MEINKALEIVKKELTEKRYTHTIGVLETAIQLAKKYEADVTKVSIAAIFHDYAKYRSVEEMKKIVLEQGMDRRLLVYGDELLHGPVGAYYVENEQGIQDEEILNAIRYHTTGRPHMTLLEKIVFLADYIEPNRHFIGVDKVRELAQYNVNTAMIKAISNTIHFLMEKGQPVYPDTITTYNALILKEEFL